MLVRRLELKDAVDLQRLRSSVDLDGTLGRPAERQRALTLENIESQLCAPFVTLGAYSQEYLAGSASLSRMPECPFDAEATEWFGLSSIIVNPDFRGKGIGRTLVNECLSIVEQQGAKGVLLVVNLPNPAAKALYDSLGFETWNIYEGAYMHNGLRFDEVSMRKRLGGA
jgi:ribosomal protein S18 acetylase RimI-like enzyme